MKAWPSFPSYDLTLREVQAISSGVHVAVSLASSVSLTGRVLHPLDLRRRSPSLGGKLGIREKAKLRTLLSHALEDEVACEFLTSSGSQPGRSNLALLCGNPHRQTEGCRRFQGGAMTFRCKVLSGQD